jgi:transglutaminase-like putative cysteine protease
MLGIPRPLRERLPRTVPAPDHHELEGADASHAWLLMEVPRAGWVDLDPTNDTVPDERCVTTAWGRDDATWRR